MVTALQANRVAVEEPVRQRRHPSSVCGVVYLARPWTHHRAVHDQNRRGIPRGHESERSAHTMYGIERTGLTARRFRRKQRR